MIVTLNILVIITISMVNSPDWTKSEKIAHKMNMADECIATIMTPVS